MASRSRPSRRSDSDSDSMEVLKPLVVLALFGTILYGAYSVVQKGPTTAEGTTQAAGDAPPFAPPAVEMAAAAAVPPSTPVPPSAPVAAPLPAAPPAAFAQAPAPIAAPSVAAPPAAAPAAAPPSFPPPPPPVVAAQPQAPAAFPAAVVAPPAASPPAMLPSEAAAAPLPSAAVAAVAAGAGAALGAAATESSRMAAGAPTYLTAESAPPPAQDSLGALAPPTAAPERPDRYAALATTPSPSALPTMAAAPAPPPSSAAAGSSAAFATAWADAHEKLAAGRYAEALAALSIWYDDPSLGLEESQRLEDLLGQLAGTVIYSQQDLLLPPHVVAAGETLPTVAVPLGISWQLLAKINGIANPQDLMAGEHLKVLRGPFDAVVSVSRRRLSLQLGGNYAGSFPVVVGRQFLGRVGGAIPVAEIRRGAARDVQAMAGLPSEPAARPSIVLADGLVIEAAEDPGVASETSPATSLVVSVRDLTELLDILGPGSKVLIRQ